MSAAMNWICSVDIKPYSLQTADNMCVAQFIHICAAHLLYPASRAKIFLPYSNWNPFTATKILSIQKQFADNRKKVLLMTQRHELYYPQEVSWTWRNTGQFHKAI